MIQNNLSDEVLAQQAVNDVEAFTLIYQRYVDRVYRYFYSRVSNKEDAQDLTAQTFLGLVKSITKYKPSTPFSIYLFAIARRKLADFLRQPVYVDFDDLEIELTSPFNTEQMVEERLRLEDILVHLPSLHPTRLEVLTLRIFAGLTPPEIAQMMQKSEGAIYVLLHRAVADLRKLVEEVTP